MKSRNDHRIAPSAVSPEILHQLDQMVHNGRPPELVGPSGDRIELPSAINDMLAFVLHTMKNEQVLHLMPEDALLTAQTAAQLLGMSRPYLLRLLDGGTIPFHRVGTHRRILLRDLLTYKAVRDADRRSRLDALTKALDDAGLYDRI